MSSGLTVSSARHEAALERLLSTSKRTAEEVLKGEARIVFKNVALYTPPAHQGVTGKAAERHAQAKVGADIYALYGTPGDAYDAIAVKSPGKASAFWLLNEQGETRAASDILREATGSILYPFDGGKHHRTNFRKRIRRGNAGFTFYVSNPQSLDVYVQQQQSHVWWLSGGWEDALTALGVRGMPYGVGKHDAPGTLRVHLTDTRLEVAMVNNVSYAAGVKDINRRILWAMDVRADRMQRNWDNYLARLAGQAGMNAS